MSIGISKAGIEDQRYLKETGKCPICDIQMPEHPQCESCLILCGPEHEYTIATFRDHELCTSCIKSWKGFDCLCGRETTWEESRNPSSAVLSMRS